VHEDMNPQQSQVVSPAVWPLVVDNIERSFVAVSFLHSFGDVGIKSFAIWFPLSTIEQLA